MNLQVLVSTMNQVDYSLLDRMNIQSDAIVINQCDKDNFNKFEYKGHQIKFLSFNERGVGLSRNNAFMRADADICIFADDDVTYVDSYKDIIIKEFINNSKADVIMFNVPSTNAARPTYIIPKVSRVRWYNCLRYGAVKIAVRTEKIKQANVYFSQLFGGGAKYSGGEDSLFVAECIRKGLKVYANPQVIGHVNQEASTWFEGYTNKYFIDRGILYYCLTKRWNWVLCLQFTIRHKKLFGNDKTWKEAFQLMNEGIKEFIG